MTGTTSTRRYAAALLIVAAVAMSATEGHETPGGHAAARAGEALGVTPVISASLTGEWTLHEGVTAIRFNRDLLEDLGVALIDVQTSAQTRHPRYLGFAMETPARIGFSNPGGALESLQGASIPHRGGATLALGEERVSMHGFVLRGGLDAGRAMTEGIGDK